MNDYAYAMVSGPLIGIIWVFGWAAFFLIWHYIRMRRRQAIVEMLHRERMFAMEKGLPCPDYPAEMDAPGHAWRRPLNPRWPLGIGALSICVGLGASLAMRLSGDAYHQQVWPFGLVGVFFGVGLFLHYALTRRRD
jgi:hypothetical protein